MKAAVPLFFCAVVFTTACDKTTTGEAGPAGQTVMGPLELSTNRQGRDLDASGVRVSTAQECSNRCAAEPQCRAMSFAAGDSGKEGFCFLKGSVSEATPAAGIVSAVKASSP
jgi:hypothetical protein